MLRTKLAAVAVLLMVAVGGHGKVFPCNFYTRQQSLLDRFLDAEILVVARMENAVAPDNLLPNGQTEVVFEKTLKGAADLKGRKSILMPRHVVNKEKFLIAMEKTKDGIDAYTGTALDANGAIVKYLAGALKLKDKSPVERVRYNVDFLHDPCTDVAESAHLEVSRASHGDLRKLADKLDPGRLRRALGDAKLPLNQRVTLALLLGLCGTKEDAAIVRKLLDEPATCKSRDAAVVFIAYVLLDRQAGWEHLTRTSVQESEPFMKRYSALLAIRQLGDERKDIADPKKFDAALLGILKVKDMSDFAVEDLRKRERWQHSDGVLDLWEKPGYNTPIMRHSILRFALQSPSPRAKAFATEQRARDPKFVAEIVELLDLEAADKQAPKK